MDYEHCFLQRREDKEDSDLQNDLDNENSVVLFDLKDCNRKRATFSMITFFYSYSTIGNLAYYSLLKDQFGMDPGELNAYYTFINFLFLLKPLYGFVTDSCPILGRHRQPYIILCGILAAVLWILMGFGANNGIIATLLMFLINGMLGLISSVSQALVVEDSQERKKQEELAKNAQNSDENAVSYNDNKAVKNVSLFFILDSIGLLLSAYLSGFLVEKFSLLNVFIIAAFVPFIISIIGFALQERIFYNNRV